MKKFPIYILLTIVGFLSAAPEARAVSFDLDSIATWGKFPRFCVNTYRWGCDFFNGFDTAYVSGTGYKFNAKITADSWMDGYSFVLPNKEFMFLKSDPSTSTGIYLTYLAVSVGYDINISRLFGGVDRSRQRYRFGFNCSLFTVEAYLSKNDIGTTLKRFGDRHHGDKYNLPFYGVNNSTWGIDAYYFFNHKRYSEAASFNYSRIQRRSQGSFLIGLSYYAQDLNFDFSEMPEQIRDRLPESWPDNRYTVFTKNYAVRFGYGFNWVFAPKWVFGVSESPTVGVRKGLINNHELEKISFSLYNRLNMSVVWNSGRLFAGATCKFDIAIVNDRETTYAGGVLSGEAVFGYRFNLW